MPRVSIDGQDLPRVLRATVVITHNVPEADPPPPAQPAPHHTHPDFWKQAAGDALARNVPLLLPGRHSPPSSALGDLLKLGLAAHEGAKEAAAQSPLPASQSSLPAAQRPHDPLQTPRAEFVLLLPLDHSVDIARWALAPMGPSRFHRVTLQTLDRFGTPKHTWIMFRAYVHAYREAEYTPRPTEPADGRRYVEVTLRGLLPPLTDYDGQNLVVVAPGQADQTANALPALSSFEEPLLASAQAATQSQLATGGGGGGVGGGRTDSAGAIDPAVLQSALLDVPASQPDAAADDPCKDCQLCVKTKPGLHDPKDENSNTYQLIDNFGASDAWAINQIVNGWLQSSHNSPHYNDQLNLLAELLFSTGMRGADPKGIGLSLWRFNVGAGRPVSSVSQSVSQQDANGNYLRQAWTQTECIFDNAQELNSYQQDGNVTHGHRQFGQQHFLTMAYSLGVRQFLAFSNSPPCWLTANGLPYSGNTDTLPTNLATLPPDSAGQFATFLASVVSYLRKRTGSSPWYISPVNEPDNPWNDNKQEGCRYDNSTIIQVIQALSQAIGGQPNTQIVGPEANSLNNLTRSFTPTYGGKTYHDNHGDYINALSGPGIGDILDHRVVAHSYNFGPNDSGYEGIRNEIRKQLGPKSGYWMSEYCCLSGEQGVPISGWTEGNPPDTSKIVDNTGAMSSSDPKGIAAALNLAKLMYYDLTKANASAWHWWTTISHRHDDSALIYTTYNPSSAPDRAGPTIGGGKPGVTYVEDDTPTLLPTKMLWAFGNYSRFIRPGARRVTVSLAQTVVGVHDVLASAYHNNPKIHSGVPAPELVVVLINLSTQPVTLTNLCHDLDVKWTHYYVTSATENLKHHQVRGNNIVLKPQSVVTLTS